MRFVLIVSSSITDGIAINMTEVVTHIATDHGLTT